MKYNTLRDFRNEMGRTLASTTATTYANAVAYLLKDQVLFDCRTLDLNMVMTKLREMKYKSQFSKYSNAFLKFCAYIGLALDPATLLEIKQMRNKKKQRYRKLREISLKEIQTRIYNIRDKRLRLSFETMLETGLRVFELSQIKKDDCQLDADTIILRFIGKGGNQEQVCIQNQSLVNDIKEQLYKTNENQPVFYSSHHLQKEAAKRGFQCHDLRRAFAKIEYQKGHTINEVKRLLRHRRLKTTRLYLNSKVRIEDK